MRLSRLTVPTFILCLITLLSSCSENSSESEFGRLSIQLTDAPFPHELVSEANVTIFKVDARQNDSEDETGYVTLMEDEIEINLLELTNGVTETLVDTEIPVGNYDLVRVYVKGVNVVMTGGESYELDVPSGEQTGIKVFIDPAIEVAGGLSADLLLDFDVSRSFVPKGNYPDYNGFNFNPVIRASNLSTAGTLQGKILTPDADTEIAVDGASVTVYDGDTEITATASGSDGGYVIMGLPAGIYNIVVTKAGFITSEEVEVEIVAANKTVTDFQLSPE
ncbi:DUF4382 domain-containing protein [Zeaxanthinibacter sp. PT1]|uniref:DUF4382 domain-containing protein n=1 Tax=Zeaxanthinibacter TaxID=561554 RepID=UPI002349106B|nr:DUF4382 domain-containing protein [Zeaxanthinibacter sp. PT1]MDC6350776.1 DUF4382 domain-containing protein [Zeaxanthinibacter sp. PT1]